MLAVTEVKVLSQKGRSPHCKSQVKTDEKRINVDGIVKPPEK